MTLHAEVGIGQRTVLGRIEIHRVTNVSPDRTTHVDNVRLRPHVVSSYRVDVEGIHVGHVAHRYGDGPWALLAAAAAIVPTPASPAATAETGA